MHYTWVGGSVNSNSCNLLTLPTMPYSQVGSNALHGGGSVSTNMHFSSDQLLNPSHMWRQAAPKHNLCTRIPQKLKLLPHKIQLCLKQSSTWLTAMAPLGKVHVKFRTEFPCPTIQAMNSQEQPNSKGVQIIHCNALPWILMISYSYVLLISGFTPSVFRQKMQSKCI